MVNGFYKNFDVWRCTRFCIPAWRLQPWAGPRVRRLGLERSHDGALFGILREGALFTRSSDKVPLRKIADGGRIIALKTGMWGTPHPLLSQDSFEKIPNKDTHNKDNHENDNPDKNTDSANQASTNADGSGCKE
jgi:hypothetical protein